MGWTCGEKNRQLLDNLYYTLDAPGTLKEPRKTKNEMEGRFRKFRKTPSSCCEKRGTVEVNGEGLHPTTDIQRLKLELKLKVPAYFSIYIHVNKVY